VPLSAREVNRLGERIKAGPLAEDDRRLLLEFRASFLPTRLSGGDRQDQGGP